MPRPYSHSLQVAFGSAPDDALTGMVWTTITPYLDVAAGIRIGRGRADEFSKIQPSTFGCTLKNTDGRFTMDNPSSPHYPNVKTGKRLRYGVAVLGNGKQLYDDDPSFEGVGSFGWFADGVGPPALTASTTFARTGAQSLRAAWGTSLAGRAYRYVKGTIPGRTYTVSAYLRVPTGSPDVTFGANGGTGVLMSTKDAFVRVSRTTVATDFQLYMTLNATSTAAGQFCYIDDVQVEEAASVSAFEITPGTFKWRFTGDVAEWPTKWDGGPAAYAETNLTAVDRSARLGELGEFDTFLREEILLRNPLAYYPLDDPAGSVTAGDTSGNFQPNMTIYSVGTGGTVTFGWDHTDGLFDYGVPDYYRDRSTALQLVPSVLGTPITGGFPSGKYLRGNLSAPILSNNGATASAWARFPSAGASDFGPIVFLTAADGSYLGIHKSAVSGQMCAVFVNMADGAGGVPQETPGSGISTDFTINYSAVLSIPSAGNGLLTLVQNGSVTGTIGPFAMAHQPAWNQTTIGGRDKTVDGVGRINVSHAQFYDYAVPSTSFAAQFFVAVQGRSSSVSTDTTTIRLQKLLAYRGLYSSVSPTTALNIFGTGPAKIGPQEIEGNPDASIELVESTEDGVFFIGGDGFGVWQLRNYRYNAAPAVTIDADQLDPEALTFRGDLFGVVNDVTASRPDGSSVRVTNTAGIADNGRRKTTVQALSAKDDDLRSLAARFAGAFSVQRNRLSGVKISLLDSPTKARALLVTDLGGKLRILNLPPQAPRVTEDVYIEGWAELISEDEWSMSFSTAPSAPWDAWQIGVAGRSEVGVTTIVRY